MTIHLGIPQIIYVCLALMGLIFAAATHGKPRGPINAYGTLIGQVLVFTLLWWGGFF